MTTTLTSLARSTTRAGSLHSYLTIRWLVDRDLTDDAFHAYAYFRWLDDLLDGPSSSRLERLALVDRQTLLLEQARAGRAIRTRSPEELWLVELVRRDRPGHPGLRSYLDHMMAVMRFDADRRGRTITAAELAGCTHCLSQAVMDGLSYFVGHRVCYPASEQRLRAASGAHVVHMLRDAVEDVRLGYFNVPLEFLAAHGLSPHDVSGPAYRLWVRERLLLARRCFAEGKKYIAGLNSARVRVAGYAYCAQFERTLKRMVGDLRRATAPPETVEPLGSRERRLPVPPASTPRLQRQRADESA
jgi:phytoene/squalene synthetase